MKARYALQVRHAVVLLAAGGLAHGFVVPAVAAEGARPDWVTPARPAPRRTVTPPATPPSSARPDWARRETSAPRQGRQAAAAWWSVPASRQSPPRRTQTPQRSGDSNAPATVTAPDSQSVASQTPADTVAARRATATAAGLDVPARAPELPATLPPQTAPVLPAEPRPFRLNPTGQPVRLPLPLINGSRELGTVTAEIAPDDRIAIDRAELVAAVTQALTPEGVAELEAGIGAGNTVAIASLNAAGYATRLDLDTMTLKIALPPNGRWPVELAVSPRRTRYSGEVATPANVSAYVNLRGNLDYSWSDNGGGLVAPDIFMDAAGRVGPLAWETDATLRTDPDDPGVTRTGSRLIYDDLNRGTRLVVGDQSNPTRSFLGSNPGMAISLSSSSNQFTPDVQPRNPGEQTVTVLRPSTIEAIVNNRSVRTFRVEPGVYRFSDFPFAQGANDLRLEITDDSGGREVVSSSLFFERTLLEPGQSEFNVTGGLEAGVDTSGLSYDADKPFVSGYYTTGINERLTLGVSGQATNEGMLGGVEARIAMASGILAMDAAVSSREDTSEGFAANIAYAMRPAPDAINPVGVGITVQYVSDGFSSVFGEAGSSPFEWQFGASLSRALGPMTSLNGSFRHAIGHDSDEIASSALVSITRRFGAAGALSLEADFTKDSDDEDWGLRLGYVHRLGDRSSARFDYATANNQMGLAWLNSGGQGVGATTTSIELRHNDDVLSGVAAIGRVGNWIDGGLSHSLAYTSATSQVQDQRTSARFATALAYADGALAISRPINGGFAIFVPDASLNGAAVEVEPSENGFEARSFAGLPAVANNLSAYALRQVSYGVPDAPLGYDIGSGSVAMRAPYRGGYLVRIGSDYNQSAVGRLVFADGSPAALLSGFASEASGDADSPDQRQPVQLFTNAAGRFGVTGLRAGTWYIDLQSDTTIRFVLTIPENAAGIFDVGTITESRLPLRQEASR